MFTWLRNKIWPPCDCGEPVGDYQFCIHPKYSGSMLHIVKFDLPDMPYITHHVMFNGFEFVFPAKEEDMDPWVSMVAMSFNIEHDEMEDWYIQASDGEGHEITISISEQQLVTALALVRIEVAGFGEDGKEFLTAFPDMTVLKPKLKPPVKLPAKGKAGTTRVRR